MIYIYIYNYAFDVGIINVLDFYSSYNKKKYNLVWVIVDGLTKTIYIWFIELGEFYIEDSSM